MNEKITDTQGLVKWFDPRKGFGFITGPQGEDIFTHFSTIQQADGFRTLRDGETVVYSAVLGSKGWSATAVTAVRTPVKQETPTRATN
jgi:CspA family cold shock protein